MASKLNPTAEERQLFMLNMLANVNSGLIVKGKKNANVLVECTNNINALLENEKVQAVVGKWKLAWGPFISYSQMELSHNAQAEHAKFLADLRQELEKNPDEANYLEQADEAGIFSSFELGHLASLGSILNDNELDSNESLSESGSDFLVTDNTMYAIRCIEQPKDVKNGPDYFIGIAGTNSVSPFGWFKEDFDVETMQEWENLLQDFDIKLPTDSGKISTASWQGLQQLWNMGQSPEHTHIPEEEQKRGRTYVGNKAATQKPLWDFIKGLTGSQKIAVSGHSLGGALAPVLGTVLADLITDTGLEHRVEVLATAGPTPGNADFMNHLYDKLAAYKAIYNEIDVVPQAWIEEDLTNAAGFYPKEFSFGDFRLSSNNNIVKQFLKWAAKRPNEKFARTTSQHSFAIKTWNEGALDLDKDTQKLLTSAMKNLATYLLWYANKNLTKINGGYISINTRREFCSYLIYLGLQHVLAYTGANGFHTKEAMDEMSNELKVFRKNNKNNIVHNQKEAAKLVLNHVLKPLIAEVAKSI